MYKAFLATVVAALAATGSAANAQLFYGASVSYPTGGTDAASTPASGVGHAAADLIRARGMYNESTANAYVKFEEARRRYMDNQREWNDIVITRQRAVLAQHDRAKDEMRARNATYREEGIGRAKLPPRLASKELDPYTGEVAWPRALQRDTFAIERGDIEKLLAVRAEEGSKSELMEALFNKTEDLRADLRFHIRELRTQEYLQARRFLDSLSLESQFPTTEPVIARTRDRNDAKTVSSAR